MRAGRRIARPIRNDAMGVNEDNLGGFDDPLPTQDDRGVVPGGFSMDWDAAVDDAKAAGVKFWGDDMRTTSAKEVQITPRTQEGATTYSAQPSGGDDDRGGDTAENKNRA